jgi:hypothetical protein
MKTDLFKEYKMLLQRLRKDESDFSRQELVEKAELIVKGKISAELMIKVAKEMVFLESLDWTIRVNHSRRILNALESGDYEINIPPYIAHRWNEEPWDYGYVYVASSDSKPGQCKLGATWSHPVDRLEKYELRYGYSVFCEWHLHVNMPFEVEKNVADEVKRYRVSGNTRGDSNEWYRMDPKALIKVVTQVIEKSK